MNIKISNSDKRSVGRPSLRSFTVRRSDSHITFSAKTANDLGLCLGSKISILLTDKEMYLCIDVENGFKLFGYKNGSKYSSFACTAKNIASRILDNVKATKVASFLVAANSTIINGCKCYKIIKTPLRID